MDGLEQSADGWIILEMFYRYVWEAHTSAADWRVELGSRRTSQGATTGDNR